MEQVVLRRLADGANMSGLAKRSREEHFFDHDSFTLMRFVSVDNEIMNDGYEALRLREQVGNDETGRTDVTVESFLGDEACRLPVPTDSTWEMHVIAIGRPFIDKNCQTDVAPGQFVQKSMRPNGFTRFPLCKRLSGIYGKSHRNSVVRCIRKCYDGFMQKGLIGRLLSMELEEKILNGSSFFALVCVFFPWIGGEWLGGKTVTYSGLGFFTSFIGLVILLLHVFILSVTLIPLTGGPAIIQKNKKDGVRFLAALFSAVLTIAVWSVHTKFTFEFSRLQIHFGLYGTLVGSLVATLYTFLRYQETNKRQVEDMFHHGKYEEQHLPPPPPLTEPEEHRMHP